MKSGQRHKMPELHELNPNLDEPGRVDAVLLTVADASIAGCIFIVPLLLGGQHPLGRLLLVLLASAAALAWTLRRSLAPQVVWRRSRVEWILLAAAALLIFQITPLPADMFAWLKGGAAQTLNIWGGQNPSGGNVAGLMGIWDCLSMSPSETRDALITFLAYSLLFIVIVQRVQSLSDVERLLRWVAMAAIAMAAFGLLQMLASNGKYFWFFEHYRGMTEDAACGSFLNRNRFASFLAMGVGSAVWWALDATRQRDSRGKVTRQAAMMAALRWLGLATVLTATVFSLSRGGTAAVLIAMVTVIFFSYRLGILRDGALMALACVMLLLAGFLATYGHQRVVSRMNDLFSGSLEELDQSAQRRTVWSATLEAAKANTPLGVGAGVHRRVCPLYLDSSSSPSYLENAGRSYSIHADNGPLEIFEETGFLGVALLAAGVGMASFWCLRGMSRSRSRRLSLALGAVAASFAASLAHNMVDCAWYSPGCMAVLVVLLAAGCRLYQLSGNKKCRRLQRTILPRAVPVCGILVLLPLSVWMATSRIGPVLAEGHWNAYRLLCQTHIARDAAEILPDYELSEDTDTTSDNINNGKSHRRADGTIEKMIGSLEKTVAWDPLNIDAHVQLAGAYLLLFEHCQENSELNRMPLAALRNAAEACEFKTQNELESWLERSVGPHYILLKKARRHARASVKLCPLEGAAYLYLADLCFIAGGGPESSKAYAEQALAVRPLDGAILLAAGNKAALGGDFDRALKLWKRSYAAGRVHQRELIRRLAGNVCPNDMAAEIDLFLDNFEPDLPILRQMEKTYSAVAKDVQLVRLRRAYAEALHAEAVSTPRGPGAADLWMEARLVHLKLDEDEAAVQCMEESLRCDPNSYKTHYRLAVAMLEKQDAAEAKRHLQWCLARKPGDSRVRNKFEEAMRLERNCTVKK